ncbi:MAG: hypothetical protein LBG92_11620 [Prevotellaceae bacterium]|nr:hypothetical protein [Prevotellaceae bacterium]
MILKENYLNQILTPLLIAGSLFVSSCEEMDLGDVASEVEVGGKLEVPIIKESRFSMYDLLKSYSDVSDVEGLYLDTLASGDISLIYTDTFRYKMSEVNDFFASFDSEMQNTGIADIFKNTPIVSLIGLNAGVVPSSVNVVQSLEQPFNMNENFSNSTINGKQKLTKILFENTTVKITVKPTFNIKTSDLLKLKISLPDGDPAKTNAFIDFPVNVETGNSEKIYQFPKSSFYIAADGKIKIEITLKGDDQTIINANDKIDIKIGFVSDNDSRYVSFGYFNYSMDNVTDLHVEDYKADLYNYVPAGSVLKFENPKFEFEAESNIGVDIDFTLDTIQAITETGTLKFSSKASLNPIKRANTLGQPVVSQLKPIDKQFFTENGNQNISDYFSTQLKSMNFHYQLNTGKIADLDNIAGLTESFIPSDGELSIRGKMTVPLSFDNGSVLVYSDTVEIDFGEDSFDDVSEIKLNFTYVNHFPIGMYADIFLLDENYRPLTQEAYQKIYIDRPEIYADGADKGKVKTGKEGKTSVGFSKNSATSIEQLKNAHYLLIKYRSHSETNPVDPMRLTASDYISAKISGEINGKLIF